MMRLSIFAMGLLGATGSMAQEQCKPIVDDMLRIACYDETTNAIPRPAEYPRTKQCIPIKNDLMRVQCFDQVNGASRVNEIAVQAQSCLKIKDDKERLACFDLAHRPPPPAPATTSNVEPKNDSDWLVQIREQGLPKLLTVAESASIGFVHENHRNSALLKASVIAIGPAFSDYDYGWHPFVSFDINQNLGATKRANTKIFGAGTRGIIFDYSQTGFALDSTVKLGAKKDSEAHTESVQLLFDNAIVIKGWATGRPWHPGKTTFQFVPKMGLSYEDLREVAAGGAPGHASSGYWGGGLTVWPSFLGKRVQLNAQAQRFADLNVSSALKKRFENFYSFGVDFYLFDPMTTLAFSPIIGLVREVGSNPLNGTVEANRTALVLRFKLN
jgi:hypothetical protein